MRFVPLCVVVLLMAAPARAELDSFGLGTGRNGALTVSTQGRSINPHAPLVASAPAGSTALRLVRTTGFTAGALVLVHQSSGFPASTPSGGTGTVTPGAVGRWELARVQSVSANPIELRLTASLANGYTAPGAQVVLVPEYTSVTVAAGASLVAPAWDGRSGGILAFLATGTVTNQSVISADGAGFWGGTFVNHPDLSGCTGLDLPPEQGGSNKGEGVVVGRFGVASGRGNLVNGGGGGNCHNAGGGGGGHGGAGGKGGRTADIDNIRDEGGLGGLAMKYSLLEQALFGGGGGAGEGNDDFGDGSGGGAGGGIVLVRAATLTGTGVYTANGQAAATTPGDDGAGGGGAGGAVILRASGQVSCGGVRASGGAGGNVSESGFALGPGGGGGGGQTYLQGTTLNCVAAADVGPAGTTAADGGVHGSTYGATAGSAGTSQQLLVAYRPPPPPAVTTPSNGAVGVSARPRFEGTTDPGVRVFVYVDGVEVVQVNSSSPGGQFSAGYPSSLAPLTVGEHRVTVVAESLGAYSQRSTEVAFNVAVTLADGGVVEQPILVVPAEGDVVGPTPLFAGVAPNGVSVGIEVDNGPEITLPVDLFGRFRYQVPAESPLAPGPHFVNVHAHNEAGETGPYSQTTRFETVVVDTEVPDAGTDVPDAGEDAGSDGDAGASGPDAGFREVPVLVVPAEGEVVDSTPLFAGVAAPGVSVSIEVDGTEVATVTADTTGAFRHPVPSEAALAAGAHSVTAQALVSATGNGGTRSPATAFQVRGPAALDVGCGCGASPAGAAGLWALLVGVSAAMRRRRK